MALDSMLFALLAVALGAGCLYWRHRAREIARSDRRNADFARSNADWLWERDSEQRFTLMTGAEVTGLVEANYLGKTMLDSCPDGTDPVVWARHIEDLREHRPFRDLVISRQRADGSRVWFAVSGLPYYDAKGRFAGYRGTSRVVTDVVQREREIAERTNELELAQARLLDFAAATSDWLWEMDFDLRFSYFSKPLVATAPGAPVGGIGQSIWDLPGHFPTSPSAVQAQRTAMLAGEPFRDFRLRRKSEEGKFLTISFSGRPIFDADGRFRGYRGTARDITAEISASETAFEAERRLHQALDAIGASLAVYDSEDRLTFRNRTYSSVSNSDPTFGIGLTFAQIMRAMLDRGKIDTGHMSRDEWFDWRMARHAAGAEPIDITFTNGRTLQIVERRTPDGGTVLIGVDVTQIRRGRQQADQQAQILTRVFESIDEGILVYDSNACLAAWNERAVGIIGIPPDMLKVGTPFLESIRYQLVRGDFGTFEDIEAEAQRRLEFNRTTPSMSEGWRPNGRYIRARRTLLRDGGWVTLFTDMTEQHRFEDALREAKEAAETANRSKSEFLAHMSHELRTPLNAVIGFSEIIHREMFGAVGEPRYIEYARDIHASGTHLLNVIGDILDIAKAEAGTAELDEMACEIEEIVGASVRLIEPRAQAGQIRVEVRVAPGLPKIDADARRMKQVLINLLSNAVKFTPPGGRVAVEAWLDADGGARFVVRDTGIGMRAEDIPRALEPFSQVENALSRRFEGTGLGLPLSKKLVELHGGTLTVESVVDRGTTVTVALPATRTLRV
ncbi:MAG: PAS-domain containing protein [Rhodospirillales bacterium]|nr:PAS-domain containing protein [Rhodospirillales bacterium]